MSVYIKGMEMPTSCEDCPMAFAMNFGILCTPTNRIVGDGEISKKQGFCPLVPVPEHGKLIEADAAKELMKPVDSIREYEPEWTWEELHKIYCKELDSLPTIIPADKEEEQI